MNGGLLNRCEAPEEEMEEEEEEEEEEESAAPLPPPLPPPSASASVAPVARGLRLHLSCLSSTGYTGVRKAPSGRYEAAHRVNGRKVQLGSFDTAVEAAVAFARAAGQAPAVVTEADGLRLHVSSVNSTGYRCVYASDSGRFQARRDVDGRDVFLGTYATAVEAAVAYARAVGEAPVAGEVGGVACEAAVVSEAGGMRLHLSRRASTGHRAVCPRVPRECPEIARD